MPSSLLGAAIFQYVWYGDCTMPSSQLGAAIFQYVWYGDCTMPSSQLGAAIFEQNCKLICAKYATE
jgi:hypothetical protein